MGLSWNRLTACQPQRGNNTYHKNKIGYVIDINLTIPRDRLFYVELKWHYKIIGDSTIGPFVPHDWSSNTLFPESAVNYSHAMFGLGLGIRF
jgi:hypothetical protein